MAYSEFLEWVAFYEKEPFGETRSDMHMAVLAATLVNVNRKKGKPAVKASKYMPDWWEDDSKPEALMAKFRAAAATATSKPVAKPKKPKATNGTGVGNTRSRAGR